MFSRIYNSNTGDNQLPADQNLYTWIAGLQQRGVPIDGVGLQCHLTPNSGLTYSPDLDSMMANMAQFAKMGLKVRVSELDMRIPVPATASGLADQATAYTTVVQVCLMSPNCVSITVWGADDAVSWIPTSGYFHGHRARLLGQGPD